MPKLLHRPPRYTLHKRSGHARCWIDGKEYFLGRHGSPESRAEFARLLAEWQTTHTAPPRRSERGRTDSTVHELALAFFEHAEHHYRTGDGATSRELANLRDAAKPLLRLYGATIACDFGPSGLKAVRSEMVKAGLARRTVNGRINRIRRIFAWGVEAELIPGETLVRLRAVAPLRAGRDGVRETAPVRPAPEAAVAAALPHLSAPIRAMVELMLATGMRPGEVQRVTMAELDRSGEVWTYKPQHHKNAHRGRDRVVFIGPKAQAILRPWLRADGGLLFSPTPEPDAPIDGRRKPRPRRPYSRPSFGQAVARACDRAGVPRWSPNQLRHSYATRVRRDHGLEAAQVLLGHAQANTTQIYAERDFSRARQVALAIG